MKIIYHQNKIEKEIKEKKKQHKISMILFENFLSNTNVQNLSFFFLSLLEGADSRGCAAKWQVIVPFPTTYITHYYMTGYVCMDLEVRT